MEIYVKVTTFLPAVKYLFCQPSFINFLIKMYCGDDKSEPGVLFKSLKLMYAYRKLWVHDVKVILKN